MKSRKEMLAMEQLCDDPHTFAYMSRDEQTPALCKLAVQLHPYNIKYVEEQTPELCMIAVEQDWRTIKGIRNASEEVCRAALAQNERAWDYIKTDAQTWLSLMKLGGDALKHVPSYHLNEAICDYAVYQDPNAIKYVPDKYMSWQMCKNAWDAATDSEKLDIFASIPEKYRNKQLCKDVVRLDGNMLEFVPERVQAENPEICNIAMRQNADAEQFVKIDMPHFAAPAPAMGM